MNRGGQLTINKSSVFVLLCFVVLFEGNYWALLSILVGPALYRYGFWAIIILACCFFLKGKFKINSILVPWIGYFALVIIRNQELGTGGYINTYRIILCMLTLFVLVQKKEWIKRFPIMLILVNFPNVLATLLFYYNNDYYEKFVHATYGSYQSGTANGLYGYRAGIADHYSQNGTYITMIVLVVAAILLADAIVKKKRKWAWINLALTAIALILTEKRAHLLFSIATLLIVYIIGNSQKISRKLLRILAAVIIALALGGIFIDQLPIVQSVLGRFESVGTDTNITKRFFMWTLAIKQFWNNPLFGSGFFGFMFNPENTNLILDASAGCHNMYIQYLSECGLVGFVLFVACIISAIYISIANLKEITKNEDLYEYRAPVIASITIQIFSLMYGMTGNVIYDRTFNFYILSVAANLAFYLGKTRFIEYSTRSKKVRN